MPSYECLQEAFGRILYYNSIIDRYAYAFPGFEPPPYVSTEGCFGDLMNELADSVEELTQSPYYTGTYEYSSSDFFGCISDIISGGLLRRLPIGPSPCQEWDLPETLNIEFSGLTEFLAPFNGLHELDYDLYVYYVPAPRYICRYFKSWNSSPPFGTAYNIQLRWSVDPPPFPPPDPYWSVVISAEGGGITSTFGWRVTNDYPFGYDGSYAIYGCHSTGSGTMCPTSAGATCVVSL